MRLAAPLTCAAYSTFTSTSFSSSSGTLTLSTAACISGCLDPVKAGEFWTNSLALPSWATASMVSGMEADMVA